MKLNVIVKKGEDKGFVANAPHAAWLLVWGQYSRGSIGKLREAIEACLEVEQDKAE
jgi:hypothetical protein